MGRFDNFSQKAKDAVKEVNEEKFLIPPRWLEAAFAEVSDEERFAVAEYELLDGTDGSSVSPEELENGRLLAMVLALFAEDSLRVADRLSK